MYEAPECKDRRETYVAHPKAYLKDALEDVFKSFSMNPPKEVLFCLDGASYLFPWEDFVIMHNLPTQEQVLRYYRILTARDDVLSGHMSVTDAAGYIGEKLG